MKKVLFVLAIAACTVACGKKEGKCCEGEQGCCQEAVVEEVVAEEEVAPEAEAEVVEVVEETPAEEVAE